MGKALKKLEIPRDRVVIMTKCFFGVDDQGKFPPIMASARNEGEFVNRVGLSRKHIFDAVDASVKRLGTYIDVLQIHRLDRETPREEIMKALNDVVESGKVRYIGASSVSLWEDYNFTSPTFFFFSLRAGIADMISLNAHLDGSLGVPNLAEHCRSSWLAPVH